MKSLTRRMMLGALLAAGIGGLVRADPPGNVATIPVPIDTNDGFGGKVICELKTVTPNGVQTLYEYFTYYATLQLNGNANYGVQVWCEADGAGGALANLVRVSTYNQAAQANGQFNLAAHCAVSDPARVDDTPIPWAYSHYDYRVYVTDNANVQVFDSGIQRVYVTRP
jgi:hypothetical protein